MVGDGKVSEDFPPGTYLSRPFTDGRLSAKGTAASVCPASPITTDTLTPPVSRVRCAWTDSGGGPDHPYPPFSPTHISVPRPIGFYNSRFSRKAIEPVILSLL